MKFLRERLPASQPTSKRLPFDSLFVLLTDRIALSYAIHERCCPLTYLKDVRAHCTCASLVRTLYIRTTSCNSSVRTESKLNKI